MDSSQLFLTLALLGLAPLLFMALTAFVKISTVLLITRGAIGAPAIPSNTIVLALAAALTVLAMAPVGRSIATRAQPALDRAEEVGLTETARALLDAAGEPLRKFYVDNSSERQRNRFLELARKQRGNDVAPNDLTVVVPAFLVTELLEAFALGFAIFLPFLIVDLIVANVLVALGVQSMNPQGLALPLKLLLFVAVDGWGLLSEALVSGYAPV